jgi:peroxiredoxin
MREPFTGRNTQFHSPMKSGSTATASATLPHPGPLPLGEGETDTVTGLNGCVIVASSGRMDSLSQRERVGVREKAWNSPTSSLASLASPTRALRLIRGQLGAAVALLVAFTAVHARAAQPLPLDLSRFQHTSFFNPNLKGPPSALPKGVQTIDGLPFQFTGRAQFAGQIHDSRNQPGHQSATGIAVGTRFDELHLVHHAFWPDENGKAIATIRLNYTDGSSAEIPIQYGNHVRDWMRLPSESSEALGDPNTKIFWRGEHPTSTQNLGATIRLFKSTLDNPNPGKEVATMDVVSTGAQSSYALVAATVAPRDPNRPVSPAVPPIEDWKFDGELKLLVVDAESGQPLDGAVIEPGMSVAGAGVVGTPMTTPKDGSVVFKFRKSQTGYLSLSVRRDGYGGSRVSWSNKDSIPAEHTFKLSAGSTIGGFVQDEEGAPIAKAAISAYGDGGGSSVNGTSASDGRWSVGGLPKSSRSLRVTVSHPEFPSGTFRSESAPNYTGSEVVRTEDFFNQTAILVLKRGVALTGVVQNEAGAPVPTATARMTTPENGSYSPVIAKVDAEGRFEFKKLKPGPAQLAVQAGGYAPDTRSLTLEAGMAPLTIVLGKGHTLKGRVVDKDNQPIEGANVSLVTDYNGPPLNFKATTDAEGRFRWGAAPAGEVKIDISKQGYSSLRYQRVAVGEAEHTFVLGRPLKISGKVNDIVTGEPIASFRVISGWAEPALQFRGQTNTESRLRWNTYNSRSFNNGVYEMTFAAPPVIGSTREYKHVIRIEAEGYMPVASEPHGLGEGEVIESFLLAKARKLTGTLLNPDGTSATNAVVQFINSGAYNGQLSGGRLSSMGGQMSSATTDAEGKFNVPPQLDEDYLVVAATDAGFAKIEGKTVEANPVVTLQKWGRIEGVKRKGKRAAVGDSLGLSFPRPARSFTLAVMINDFANVGADGKFTFERVPPGTLQLYQRKPMPGFNGWTHLDLQTIEVTPGGTNHVDLGGTGGLSVVAKLVRPAGLDRAVSLTNCTVRLVRDVEAPKIPVELKTNMAAISKWMRDWTETDAGKKYQAAMAEVFDTVIEPDGTFRADGLTPGAYQLSFSLMRAFDRSRPPTADDLLASASKKFEVKPPENPLDDIDLGKIELTLHRTLKVGDAAPDFTVKTVDGKPLKLADYKGKFVLLDFWATWCGPCVAELPHLKAVWDAHGNDKRFAMIALSLDAEAADAKTFAAKNGMKWTQGFLGDWSEAKLPAAYGVRGIPATFLIGPDGRIIAKDLRGEALGKAVAKALGGK